MSEHEKIQIANSLHAPLLEKKRPPPPPANQDKKKPAHQSNIIVIVSHGSTQRQRDPEMPIRQVGCRIVFSASIRTYIHQPEVRHHSQSRRQIGQELLNGFRTPWFACAFRVFVLCVALNRQKHVEETVSPIRSRRVLGERCSRDSHYGVRQLTGTVSAHDTSHHGAHSVPCYSLQERRA